MREICLQAEHLKKSYRTRNRFIAAVDDVSFAVRHGETVGIAGESGSGKTTIARMVTGIEKPDSGSVTICGQPLARSERKWIQMVFQYPQGSFSPRKTVGDTILDSVRNFRLAPSAKEGRSLIAFYFERVGLSPDLMSRYPHELSGGQCQRAAIVRAVLPEPELLLLDEATSALDVLIQEKIVELLNDLRKESRMSMLFISHDLALLSNLCDRILIMKDGRLVESGSPEQLILSPQEAYTRLLLDSVLEV